MKKILALAMVLCLVLALAACGGAASSAAPSAAPVSTAGEASTAPAAEGRAGDVNGDGKFMVGYIAKNTTDTKAARMN